MKFAPFRFAGYTAQIIIASTTELHSALSLGTWCCCKTALAYKKCISLVFSHLFACGPKGTRLFFPYHAGHAAGFLFSGSLDLCGDCAFTPARHRHTSLHARQIRSWSHT